MISSPSRAKILALGALLAFSAPGIAATARAESAPVDYFTAPFSSERVLDWGTRPDWSPDGRRIAFTTADERDSHAYELDLASGEVRCLTCWLGMAGLITRVYYLPDSSFLFAAARNLDSPEFPRKRSTVSDLIGDLYWMPAAGKVAPQRLGVSAFGEIAISRRRDKAGGVKIAWGELHSDKSLIGMATLVRRGGRAALIDRRTVYDSTLSVALAEHVRASETYGFGKRDSAITFFTIRSEHGVLDGEMFEVDLSTGKLRNLSHQPNHNETHLFPDERFGLEESNRASDPVGALRGISAVDAKTYQMIASMGGLPVHSDTELASYAPFGPIVGMKRGFDIFVVAMDGSNRTRQLTDVSRLGGGAHQSAPAADGRRIVYAIDERGRPELTGKGGLYIGEFGASR